MTFKSPLLAAIEQNLNYTETQNAALTHKSTLSPTLDFFYLLPASRGKSAQIIPTFIKALDEDPVLTTTALFYARDIRGGQGERQLFRDLLVHLAQHRPEMLAKVIPLVPEYGRWDDLNCLMRHEVVGAQVRKMVKDQLVADLEAENPSLLAKWAPTIKTSGKGAKARERRRLAAMLAEDFGWTPREYRVLISQLRKRLKIVERFESANQWSEINYSHVPSVCMLKQRKAFSRHDGERFGQYLAALKKGDKSVKINAATLYPYDLVRNYVTGGYGRYGARPIPPDPVVEEQWKALPNYLKDTDTTFLGVADVSGSMLSGINGSLRPIDVAISLAIYAAERAKGIFAKSFFTFSAKPTLQYLAGETLAEKVRQLDTGECANTNLQAVFDCILAAAVRAGSPQSDMPKFLIIISDMEFDAAEGYSGWGATGRKTNFQTAKDKFNAAGYELPNIVFWNVNAKQKQTPVTKDQNGVFLVSGCSPSILKAALNATASNPLQFMIEALNTDRYKPVIKALME